MSALQKHNAAAPDAMTKLILDSLDLKEDGSLKFKIKDKEFDIDDGVGEWAKENPWAIKTNTSGGAGGTGGGGVVIAIADTIKITGAVTVTGAYPGWYKMIQLGAM